MKDSLRVPLSALLLGLLIIAGLASSETLSRESQDALRNPSATRPLPRGTTHYFPVDTDALIPLPDTTVLEYTGDDNVHYRYAAPGYRFVGARTEQLLELKWDSLTPQPVDRCFRVDRGTSGTRGICYHEKFHRQGNVVVLPVENTPGAVVRVWIDGLNSKCLPVDCKTVPLTELFTGVE